jgi:hypothetical protein
MEAEPVQSPPQPVDIVAFRKQKAALSRRLRVEPVIDLVPFIHPPPREIKTSGQPDVTNANANFDA